MDMLANVINKILASILYKTLSSYLEVATIVYQMEFCRETVINFFTKVALLHRKANTFCLTEQIGSCLL